MELYPIIADLWKMDGGVSFGVVPKSIWNKNAMADENNMIPIVTRCLLVMTGSRLILIDAGMGDKQDEKYYRLRSRESSVTLIRSLNNAGFKADEITDVFFTHLHDDHVGGATYRNENGNIGHVFSNATYYCSKSQWEWAIHPNKREGASYFRENLLPLQESNRLVLIDEECEMFPGIRVKLFNGHTMGQLIPFIDCNGHTIVFLGDFIPTTFNIPLPYVPAVDIQPLVTMEEKSAFLKEAVEKKYMLVFEHDYFCECCTVKQNEKLVAVDSMFSLASLNKVNHA